MTVDSKPPLSLGVLLPLATIGLYAYSYIFELGYAFYFGYPVQLIAPSVYLIANFGVAVFFYALMAFGFLQLNLQTWPMTPRHVFLLVVLLISFLFGLIALKAWNREALRYAYFLIPATAYLGGIAAHRWQKEGNKEVYDKVPMAYDARSNVPENSIASAIVRRLRFDPLLLSFLVVMVLPALFCAAGYADARSQTTFYEFTDGGTSYISLQFTGESVIAARFDPTANHYYSEFVVRTAGDLKALRRVQVVGLKWHADPDRAQHQDAADGAARRR